MRKTLFITSMLCAVALCPAAEPLDDTGSKVYTIKWKNSTESYMTEQSDGRIAIGDYSTSAKIFWEFIPTGNEDCYYIRNTASKKYIGSCNLTPSSASKVYMSDTPVEYYVHISSATSGQNQGCYWFSSTDCADYDKEASEPRCLNKDGASTYVITWLSGISHVGSYWSLVDSEDLYEIRPFTPSPEIGGAHTGYHIMNPAGEAYASSGEWMAFNPADKTQQWYFVGTSNADGGYQIVSEADNAPLNSGTSYKVGESADGGAYRFLAADGSALALGDVTDFTFVTARSAMALDYQIYKMPCGSVGSVYIRKASFRDDYFYPMKKYVNKRLSVATASTPANKYVMLTRDALTLTPGEEVPFTMGLNTSPGDYEIYLHFDWDRDGYFETTRKIEADTKNVEGSFTVPATAKGGKTRLRIRVTDNGLSGGEDDTHGEVLDLMLEVSDEAAEPINPTVTVNDPLRGTAQWADGIASATPKGNSTFLYWTENRRIVSVDAAYEAAASKRPRELTAFFAPNTQEIDGIDPVILGSTDSEAQILFNGSEITVRSAAGVKAIVVYSTAGAKVAGTCADSLTLGAPAGIYIVKAITANGVASAKIKI